MPMKRPAHPGRLLKDDLEALGLTVNEASKALGVTRQQLYRVLNGTSAVTPTMAIRMEKAIGTSADTWLRMQAAYDLAEARLATTTLNLKRISRKVA
ncbi:MAG: HigA family addiction module antitoxin [Hyphomicrobium sp.]